MPSSLTTIFLILCLAWFCQPLRIHGSEYSHLQTNSTTVITNPTQAEKYVQSQLSTINLQIAAVNNTISKNLYFPYMEDGQVTLQNATANPDSKAQLCIVFNDSQATDVGSYIASI